MLSATSPSAEELQYSEHSSELQYSGKERALYARCYIAQCCSTKTVELQTLLSATAQESYGRYTMPEHYTQSCNAFCSEALTSKNCNTLCQSTSLHYNTSATALRRDTVISATALILSATVLRRATTLCAAAWAKR